MAKYIAFLRGINVGNIRIKMADLKSMFEEIGFQEVKIYLQTGNVVFESPKAHGELKPLLEKALSETFHYHAYVLLYPFDDLADIIAQYPMTRDEGHHAYVIFIDKPAVFEELRAIAATLGEESANIMAGNNVIYWKVLIGQSTDTPFSKASAKAKYKSSVTVRNLNTLEKMV
ncbi:MAG: DUF1697 domain-containing protein [Saprospiraceae bacterium]|nr:DUF1697 domain-containing protein [Saprospiraceae bacterium]MDZ4703210.1 DUF1697 domain-containing protein [Saprospiraceae bacterium]